MGSTVFPAAASGPTLSEITSAGTSAGWGATKGADITWTQLSYQSPSASSVTFSSLSGYKYYKVIIRNAYLSGTQAIRLRINNDSSSNNYMYYGTELNASGTTYPGFSFGTNGIFLGVVGVNSCHFNILITGADQSVGLKDIYSEGTYWDSSWKIGKYDGDYYGSGAVTSITVYSESGGTFVPQGTPYGFYLFGGN